MKVEIRYFASIREALGEGEALEVRDAADVAAVRDVLIAKGGRHAEALGRQRAVRGARNRVLVAETAAVADGDEIGFFPPVTGG